MKWIGIIIMITIAIKSFLILTSDEWIANKNPLPVIGVVIPLFFLISYIVVSWEDFDNYYIDFNKIINFFKKTKL